MILRSSTCLRTIYFFLFLIAANFLVAQEAQKPGNESNVLIRKLFVHTDRDQYFAGDTIWMRGHYIDGQSHLYVPGVYNMYTHLISSDGKIMAEEIWPVDNGGSVGRLDIEDDLPPGKYLLRAYTDIMRLGGEDLFFNKEIEISKVGVYNEITQDNYDNEFDIDFLPEGGILLTNKQNIVAIKAVNNLGVGITTKGAVKDSKGNSVAVFSTDYNGMDTIQFVPESNEVYTAHIHSPKLDLFELPKSTAGLKISLKDDSSEILQFEVNGNSADYIDQRLNIVLMSRGVLIFSQPFIYKGGDFPIKIYKEAFLPGINQLILTDQNFRPLSERLYFSSDLQTNHLKISVDKPVYSQRDLVSVDLSGSLSEENLNSSLSMTVINAAIVEGNEPSSNIMSWLFIDSDLKGRLGNTMDYLVDDNGLTSNEKLNLLMLTHGWSKYNWSQYDSISNDQEETEGLTYSGTAQRSNIKPLAYNHVGLQIINEEFVIEDSTETDADGRFTFSNISFTDSAFLMIQSRNKRERLVGTVELDPIHTTAHEISEAFLPPAGEVEFSDELTKEKYYADLALNEYLQENGVILLDEVRVKGKAIEQTIRKPRIYSKPSSSYKVTQEDISFLTLFDFLRAKASGVTFINGQLTIRGVSSITGSSEPLFLLDGAPVSSDVVATLPMATIAEVDVLKNASEAAIFGSQGANGVIAVFTKTGRPEFQDYDLPGTISMKIKGYSEYKEFYSPNYSDSNVNAQRPDHRLTLHWNPNIVTVNGSAKEEFYTSDSEGEYIIVVQGMTTDGRVSIGEGRFAVSSFQKKQ